MSSPSVDYLNTMWQYLPQGHEKPFKQAFFNTIANVFLLLACAVLCAVYFILAPFLRPLYWALLCGTFLYPFKRRLTNLLRHWLKGLQSSGTPFAIGIVILPFQVANSAAESLTQMMLDNMKLVFGVIFGMPFAYMCYSMGLFENIVYVLQFVFAVLYEFTGFLSTPWVWTLFIGYLMVVIFLWNPGSQSWLKKVSIPLWIILLCHVASAAGSMRVPLLLLLVVVMIVGFFVEVCQNRKNQKEGPDSPATPLYLTVFYSIMGCPEAEEEDTDSENSDEINNVPSPVAQSTPIVPTKPSTLSLKMKPSQTPSCIRQRSMFGQSTTSHFLHGLLLAHVVVRLWMHFWIIILLVMFPVCHVGMKFLWNRFCSDGKLKKHFQEGRVGKWLDERKEVMMPRSLRGLMHIALKGDQQIISGLEVGLDTATSILLILALLVGALVFSLVAAVQIQSESMYMIKSTQGILNKTMNSEFSHWLPDAELLVNTMDQVMKKGHEHGRNLIASKVREFVDTDSEEQDNLVNQMLEVWDRVYETWKSHNETSESPPLTTGIGDINTLWDMISKRGLFDIYAIIDFVKENIGMFMSVLESIWTVLKGNMNLVLTVITSILSALLGGGTAILNFVLNYVIFLTVLFYLLSGSGEVYKPVEIFSSMSPGSSKFGQAVEEAINGVFMASVKMATFYGGYTWLIHLIFDINVVFMPSALAALLAAIPFLGPYWAAVPAAMELWLVQGRGMGALILFAAHLLPLSVVDAAMYSEIKGTHPYLTGLAIAGGMMYMGLEGAIIGPIVLCFLIVVFNMYQTILINEPTTPTPTGR